MNPILQAAEYRQIASALRAQALAGGGVVQYTFNGKTLRRETVKDLLAAAKELDAEAAMLEGLGRGQFAPTNLVWRGR